MCSFDEIPYERVELAQREHDLMAIGVSQLYPNGSPASSLSLSTPSLNQTSGVDGPEPLLLHSPSSSNTWPGRFSRSIINDRECYLEIGRQIGNVDGAWECAWHFTSSSATGQDETSVCGARYIAVDELMAHFCSEHFRVRLHSNPISYKCTLCETHNDHPNQCLQCGVVELGIQERWLVGYALPDVHPILVTRRVPAHWSSRPSSWSSESAETYGAGGESMVNHAGSWQDGRQSR